MRKAHLNGAQARVEGFGALGPKPSDLRGFKGLTGLGLGPCIPSAPCTQKGWFGLGICHSKGRSEWVSCVTMQCC